MMTMTLRMRKQRVFAVIFSLFFMILIIVAAWLGKQDDHTLKTQETLTENTNDERIKFLNGFGWQTGSEPCTISDVLIPAEFDDVYSKYNDLQIAQGFDLGDYKSLLVKKYTYEILNYPNAKEGEVVYANLLIYQNDVIGGDISSARLDGFMQGFNMP